MKEGPWKKTEGPWKKTISPWKKMEDPWKNREESWRVWYSKRKGASNGRRIQRGGRKSSVYRWSKMGKARAGKGEWRNGTEERWE
jgi:hypothetical protein